jgi:hypothetical protein
MSYLFFRFLDSGFSTLIEYRNDFKFSEDFCTFEVMTSVHPPNRFAHKERIWYDSLCPHANEEMTRRT